MQLSDLDDMLAHYELGQEAARLSEPFGSVEFERTQQIVIRALPPAPATIADIGGGPGRYAVWLSELGYAVEHRDLSERHVEHLRALAPRSVNSAVGDARTLDMANNSVDAVLLLGPLYHLTSRDERLLALRESKRIVKPGGPVFAAAISRWAPRLHGMVAARLYETYPQMSDLVEEVERSGVLPPLHDGSFCGYTHRPAELEAEVIDSGLEVTDLVGIEGLAFALADLEQRVADATGRDVVLAAARSLERVPELLGLSPHFMVTARKPT